MTSYSPIVWALTWVCYCRYFYITKWPLEYDHRYRLMMKLYSWQWNISSARFILNVRTYVAILNSTVIYDVPNFDLFSALTLHIPHFLMKVQRHLWHAVFLPLNFVKTCHVEFDLLILPGFTFLTETSSLLITFLIFLLTGDSWPPVITYIGRITISFLLFYMT